MSSWSSPLPRRDFREMRPVSGHDRDFTKSHSIASRPSHTPATRARFASVRSAPATSARDPPASPRSHFAWVARIDLRSSAVTNLVIAPLVDGGAKQGQYGAEGVSDKGVACGRLLAAA